MSQGCIQDGNPAQVKMCKGKAGKAKQLTHQAADLNAFYARKALPPPPELHFGYQNKKLISKIKTVKNFLIKGGANKIKQAKAPLQDSCRLCDIYFII